MARLFEGVGFFLHFSLAWIIKQALSRRGFPSGQAASRKAAAFSISGPRPLRRVIAYVDGFNLYHAIDELRRPDLKWVDLRALASSLCGANETLIETCYFWAFATWLPDETKKHREYVTALKCAGVLTFMGHFKQKRRSCRNCGAQWIGHEEKESDVAMASQIVADAFQDKFERALIVTADSDIAPALRIVTQAFPDKTLDVIAPPGRHSHARSLAPKLVITPGRLARCLLPEKALADDGRLLFQRPEQYRPKD